MYESRFYRDWVESSGLVSFRVVDHESDLMIRARRALEHQARDLLADARRQIKHEISRRPEFADSLSPLPASVDAGKMVASMIDAARQYGVGPMAAVAGAVAQFVGEGLLRWSAEVIVENGGDIFVLMERSVEMGFYAGEESPFSGTIRLRVNPAGVPLGVCTSSGTVGHSLSFGRADAVVAECTALADAAATAIGNRVDSVDDVEKLLKEEKERGLLKGLLLVMEKRIGAFGAIELAR